MSEEEGELCISLFPPGSRPDNKSFLILGPTLENVAVKAKKKVKSVEETQGFRDCERWQRNFYSFLTHSS